MSFNLLVQVRFPPPSPIFTYENRPFTARGRFSFAPPF